MSSTFTAAISQSAANGFPPHDREDLRLLISDLEEAEGNAYEHLRWRVDAEVDDLYACKHERDDLALAARGVLAGEPGALDQLRAALERVRQ